MQITMNFTVRELRAFTRTDMAASTVESLAGYFSGLISLTLVFYEIYYRPASPTSLLIPVLLGAWMMIFVPHPPSFIRAIGAKGYGDANEVGLSYWTVLLNRIKNPGSWIGFAWWGLPLAASSEISSRVSAGSVWIWPLLVLWLVVVPAIAFFLVESHSWRLRRVLWRRLQAVQGAIFTANRDGLSFKGPTIDLTARWRDLKNYTYTRNALILQMSNGETYPLPRRLFSTEEFAVLWRYVDPLSEATLPPLSILKARFDGHDLVRKN